MKYDSKPVALSLRLYSEAITSQVLFMSNKNSLLTKGFFI